MSSLWHGESRLPEEVHQSGLSASRRACFRKARLSTGKEQQASTVVIGESTMVVSGVLLPELRVARLLPQLQPSSQLGVSWWQWWQSCAEAGYFRGLPLECDRLRGGSESLGSDAMVVEESASAKTKEHDRLKALDASIVNLDQARGGKLDVAIDEVLRQKRLERQELKDRMQSRKLTKALLRAAIAARKRWLLSSRVCRRRRSILRSCCF